MKYLSAFALIGIASVAGHHDFQNPEVCQNAVSRTTTKMNSYCMNACYAALNAGHDIDEIPAFKDKTCVLQFWDVTDGKVDLTGSLCFNNGIYGYSEPEENAAKNGEGWIRVSTPAQCQLKCQQDPDCQNWFWVSDLKQESAPNQVHMCNLKNSTQVAGALKVVTQKSYWPDVGPTMNTDWCNYGMERECATDHYECLSCKGYKRCVWHSDMHVAGNKYCVSSDPCGSSTSTSTSQLRTTCPTTKKHVTSTKPTTKRPTTPKPTTSTACKATRPTMTFKGQTTKHHH